MVSIAASGQLPAAAAGSACCILGSTCAVQQHSVTHLWFVMYFNVLFCKPTVTVVRNDIPLISQ